MSTPTLKSSLQTLREHPISCQELMQGEHQSAERKWEAAGTGESFSYPSEATRASQHSHQGNLYDHFKAVTIRDASSWGSGVHRSGA